MSLERVFKHQPGLDVEIETISNFVGFVENLTAHERAFAILQRTTAGDMDKQAISQELRNHTRPIIGYGGQGTFPFISDPDQAVKGALAIVDGQLIYGPQACPLHQMRDSYTWGFSLVKYYTHGSFVDVIHAFVERGYDLSASQDLVDYRITRPFSIQGPITLEEILHR